MPCSMPKLQAAALDQPAVLPAKGAQLKGWIPLTGGPGCTAGEAGFV